MISELMSPNPNRNRLSWLLHHSAADTEVLLNPFWRMTLPRKSTLGPGPSARAQASRVNCWLARLAEWGISTNPWEPNWNAWPDLPETNVTFPVVPLLPSTMSRAVPSAFHHDTRPDGRVLPFSSTPSP